MTERRKRTAARAAARPPARPARHESSAGGVVFRVSRGRVLFLLIRDSYGHWGFPKGHVERGEQADRAAVREVMEETGLRSVSVRASIDTIEWYFRFRGTLIHKNCEFFLMETASWQTTPQVAEGITDCRWVGLDDAMVLIKYANARAVLRLAHRMVGARAAGRPATAAG